MRMLASARVALPGLERGYVLRHSSASDVFNALVFPLKSTLLVIVSI